MSHKINWRDIPAMTAEQTAALTDAEMDAVCSDLLDAAESGDLAAFKILGDVLDGPVESEDGEKARRLRERLKD